MRTRLVMIVACAAALTACHGSSGGITRVSETTSAPASSQHPSSSYPSTSKPTTSKDSTATSSPSSTEDSAKRVRDAFGMLKNPVIAAAQDGTGAYQIKVAPQPTASGPGAFIAVLCTGGPNVGITLDGASVPPGGLCGDEPGATGMTVALIVVRADPAAPHTIDVNGAEGQHSWVSLAYGQPY